MNYSSCCFSSISSSILSLSLTSQLSPFFSLLTSHPRCHTKFQDIGPGTFRHRNRFSTFFLLSSFISASISSAISGKSLANSANSSLVLSSVLSLSDSLSDSPSEDSAFSSLDTSYEFACLCRLFPLHDKRFVLFLLSRLLS